MNMSQEPGLQNRVKERRTARGWSQDELAQRSGISRAGVSAIEIGRLVPSTAAALALAAALECRVEELFSLAAPAENAPQWAWMPSGPGPQRYWHATVAGRKLRYPVENTCAGQPAHDGLFDGTAFHEHPQQAACETLVIASCDPAAGILVSEIARQTPFRLIVLSQSSREALRLLADGVVHAAGVHFAAAGHDSDNAAAVGRTLSGSFDLLRVAEWQEGLAFDSQSGVNSVRGALRRSLRWVGRETGSAARQCLDELLHDRSPPRRIARDHRGVAEAIRCGWADIGVCHRLVGTEVGLRFLTIREEMYDLCFPHHLADDPRIQALVRVVQSPEYRHLLGEVPGCDSRHAGELQRTSPPQSLQR